MRGDQSGRFRQTESPTFQGYTQLLEDSLHNEAPRPILFGTIIAHPSDQMAPITDIKGSDKPALDVQGPDSSLMIGVNRI